MKLVGSLLFAFAFSVSGSSLAAEALFDSSDVSALLPLPDPEHPLSSDIRLSDVGIKGAIFSKQNFERLPLFRKQFSNMDEAYQHAYVTSFRFDACVPKVNEEA